MKKCLNCGAENKNENLFCSSCGNKEFTEPNDLPVQPQPTVQMNEPAAAPPPMPQPQFPPIPRKPFGVFDLLTILGFVSSIVGLFCSWVVLEPLAIVSSLIGFIKGTRSKGLAAAGIVIAVIAFIIRLFLSLYDNNVIGKWAVEGIFR
ncbi:MAG: zinc ribbon domain-containing protein [Ruminiclostridium sp.]|nr:zinc ribbon domain-containing protein [Ruminiclostridium sp.]